MAICKIGGLLLRHFSVVFNGTTATAAVRSHLRFALRRQDNFQLVLSQFMLKVS